MTANAQTRPKAAEHGQHEPAVRRVRIAPNVREGI
jgi:hypothetical protein